MLAEHPPAPGADVGGGDEELDRAGREPLEVDDLGEDVGERVRRAADRVGRDQPRHQVHGDEGRRVVERPVPVSRSTGVALERAEAAPPARPAARSPRAPPAPPSRPPVAIAVGEDGGVHRAGGGPGDRLDLDPVLLEQPVEHAPGEGAVRPAALERQVDFNGARPAGASSAIASAAEATSAMSRLPGSGSGALPALAALGPRPVKGGKARFPAAANGCKAAARDNRSGIRDMAARRSASRGSRPAGKARTPAPPPPAVAAPPARLALLWRSFSAAGLVLGTLFFAASLTPSLIPRSFVLQGVLAGVSFAVGYAIGVALDGSGLARAALPARPSGAGPHLGAAAVAAAIVLTFLWRAAGWQNSIRAADGHGAGRERPADRGRGDRAVVFVLVMMLAPAVRPGLLARPPLRRPLRARADLAGDRPRRRRGAVPDWSPTG